MKRSRRMRREVLRFVTKVQYSSDRLGVKLHGTSFQLQFMGHLLPIGPTPWSGICALMYNPGRSHAQVSLEPTPHLKNVGTAKLSLQLNTRRR